MNMSELITSIKMDLGIYTIALPFENANQVLEDVIKIKTIKTFSIYQPTYQTFMFNLSDLSCIRKTDGCSTYILPDIFKTRELLFVRNIEYAETNFIAADVYGVNTRIGSLTHQNMLANANSKLVSALIPKVTFHYRHPREVDLYNVMNSNVLRFELAFKHDDNLGSIPETCWESFSKLATLDIKKFLYNTLKHYDQIDTAYGTINLKMDDWSSAEADREQLLEQWADIYHIDITAFEYA